MKQFYGFDLGDAESCIARLAEDQNTPEILPVKGEKSFVTAYALLPSGDLLIGESACYNPKAAKRKIRFKSRILTDPQATLDVRAFASGVLSEMYAAGELEKKNEAEVSFYIGCPAGWSRNTREQYRELFETAGYPPAKIVSESRAALVAACQSRHLQVGYDILSKPLLVIDIGSSTTDFAYVNAGKETELRTGGEVMLGGGIMDEILLEECVKASENEKKIRRVFAESEPWKNYCEFAARRLKEKYFSDEEYWKEHPLAENVQIAYRLPVKLRLFMNEETAAALTEKGSPGLSGKSFREVFQASLKEVRKSIKGPLPELVFLTGGVSRHPLIRTWCEDAFPEAVIITGKDPEFSVAEGLAFCGRIDWRMRNFRRELEEFIASDQVEKIVEANIRDLYQSAALALVDPVLEQAALPVFDRWRDGEIAKLSSLDAELQHEMERFLKSPEAKKILEGPIRRWLRPVGDALEEYTMPICMRNGVPYRTLSLNSYLSASELNIDLEAKSVFALEGITLLIDAIISLLVGMLCGGGGIALVSSGFTGMAAGAVISLIVLLLGKGPMEKAVMNADIPVPLRKLVPRAYFKRRLKDVSKQVRGDLYESLSGTKNEEITERMSAEISAQIEECLSKMAQVAELPLT